MPDPMVPPVAEAEPNAGPPLPPLGDAPRPPRCWSHQDVSLVSPIRTIALPATGRRITRNLEVYWARNHLQEHLFEMRGR